MTGELEPGKPTTKATKANVYHDCFANDLEKYAATATQVIPKTLNSS